MAVTLEKSDTERQIEAPLLDINYGWGERVQLKWEIPWVIFTKAGEGSRSGLGHSIMGVKWRFLDEEQAGVAAAVYPQVTFNSPASLARRGLVEEESELLVPFELAKSFGDYAVDIELGHAFVHASPDRWIYGLALGHKASERIEWVAEFHGTARQPFTDREEVINVGARVKLGKRTALLVSSGTGLVGSQDSRPRFLAFLGLRFLR